MDTKNLEYGFTGKVRKHKPGLQLNFPEKTVQSAEIKNQDLLHMKIRNMNGEKFNVSRKTSKSGKHVEIYLTKEVKQELSLEDKDLVDVFFTKD